MTDTPKTPPTAAEQEKAFRQSLAMNVETVRAGLFATGIEIMKELRSDGTPQPEAVLLTAAVEFAAQLWAQVAYERAVPAKKSRETLEKEIRAYHRKHFGPRPSETRQ